MVHATITGTPVLGSANADATHGAPPTTFHPDTASVSVIAGTDTVAPVATGCDGGSCGANTYFAIDFNGVIFSGAQFYLYISENGFANVNTTAGDVKYAGPFSASALLGTGTIYTCGAAGFTCSGGIPSGTEYWVGLAAATDMIVGAIPVAISTAYQYIKVYDGSCGTSPTFCGGTGIAGAKQLILVQPGIVISPNSGPAWSPVDVSGGGFPANAMTNINYTFTYYSWATGTPTAKFGSITTGIKTGPGYFGPVLMSMVDTKQGINAHGGPYNPVPITVTAVNATHPATIFNSAQNTAAPVIFNEYSRVFNQVASYFSGAAVSITTYGNYGNSSAAKSPTSVAPYLPGQPIDVYVTGSLGIVGSNFTVGGTVTVWVGGVNSGTFTASAAGYFVANVTVPKLPVGGNDVVVVTNNVNYIFYIDVLPTLILTPDSGVTASFAPTGDVVTAVAYGFPANSWVSLWWNEYSLGDGNDYFLLNSTIDSTGSYNHTITFEVPPEVYGGLHEVQATTNEWPATVLETTLYAGSGYVTEAGFTVQPSMVFTSNSTVNSNQKGMMSIQGTGFDPTKLYYVNIDNSLSLSGAPGLEPAPNGDMNINFTSAGFRPGTHQVEVFDWVDALGSGSYAPTAWVYFNVTLTGDLEGNAIAAFQTSMTNIQTDLAAVQSSLTDVTSSLTSITGSLTSISSSLTGITSSLSGVTSSITGIQSSLGTISSTLSGIQGSLTTITGDVSGLGGQLTTLQGDATSLQTSATSLTSAVSGLGTTLSGITSTLTSMQGTLSTISTNAGNAASSAATAATEATDATNGSATAQTYVLVVAVLAAITLVLELAILVRKLS